jgi:hypothetical protein
MKNLDYVDSLLEEQAKGHEKLMVATPYFKAFFIKSNLNV